MPFSRSVFSQKWLVALNSTMYTGMLHKIGTILELFSPDQDMVSANRFVGRVPDVYRSRALITKNTRYSSFRCLLMEKTFCNWLIQWHFIHEYGISFLSQISLKHFVIGCLNTRSFWAIVDLIIFVKYWSEGS